MADEKLLEILRQGFKTWNEWREANRPIKPDFSNAELGDADLSRTNLAYANLTRADLSGAKLTDADLTGAELGDADFPGANLRGANLARANLVGANLPGANLSRAKILNANLTDADLKSAVLKQALLAGSNFTGADLTDADLRLAHFPGANLSMCILGLTTFGRNDLSGAIGLETAVHHYPSTIGIDTLFLSKGRIPEVFLRGAGVPDILIDFATSLVGASGEFYSCFISYSTTDEEFASRLHNDFQKKGVRCWKWDHDARTGRSLWGEIDGAIRDSDKLVLIASASSLKSPAVNREIERALVQEDERQECKLAGDSNADCDVLFPVRLDDFIFDGWDHERKVDVTKKVIADAHGWKDDPSVYPRVLERLLRDLKSEKAKSALNAR